MALAVNLGQQNATINSGNVPSDANIDLTLGSNGTLVVDGTTVTIESILGANIVSNTTVQAINGAHVTVDSSVAGVNAGQILSSPACRMVTSCL
jgi:hypothetical protein